MTGEHIVWYDHTDHKGFDVCADDHCQRYQGIGRIKTPIAEQAVNETKGLVLTHNNVLCDARFSKCCGGITEQFENCWEPVHYPYLSAVADCKQQSAPLPDLTNEKQAIEFINSQPKAFCNTNNKAILKQVLNDFDLVTTGFYRWQVTYSQNELQELLLKKSGINFGQITELMPVERGVSGRIVRLKISGSKTSLTIGKELEIRKWLSPTHLYSSAFIVFYKQIKDGIPQQFELHGAGWGHGVGLCQIGAAVMAHQGYNYKQILAHYFKQSTITKWY